ncbi:hypothetical protein ACVIM8_005232 [Bradyrhizobium sp. USDA 4529]
MSLTSSDTVHVFVARLSRSVSEFPFTTVTPR